MSEAGSNRSFKRQQKVQTIKFILLLLLALIWQTIVAKFFIGIEVTIQSSTPFSQQDWQPTKLQHYSTDISKSSMTIF